MKRILSLVLGFLVGLATIFLISHLWQKSENQPNPKISKVSPKPRAVTVPPNLAPPTIAPEEIRKQLKEAGDDWGKRKRILEGLSVENAAAALSIYDGGFYGLENLEELQVFGLFRVWYTKSPNGALAWLRTLKGCDRVKLLEPIVNEVLDKDLDAAMKLLREEGADDEGRIQISYKMVKVAVAQGADKLVEVCRLGLARHGGGSGSAEKFPKDFDFCRALDGLAKAREEAGQGALFSHAPSNLLEEWAKRDPQAAWKWVQQGKEVEFNDEADFFNGMAEKSTPEEIGAFLGKNFNPKAEEQSRYRMETRVIVRHPLGGVLDSFLANAPGKREAHLEGLLMEMERYGGSMERTNSLILERMTPAGRVAALKRVFKWPPSEERRNALKIILLRLGHSEKEIDTLLPIRKDH